MDVFALRDHVVGEYARYVRSFVEIRDPRIASFVDEQMRKGVLWPDPLVQLNPAFQRGDAMQSLVGEGVLHPACTRIFASKKDGVPGEPFRLHRHQVEAIRAARTGASYVLTTGTGSGKSLSYIVPIVDHVLRKPEYEMAGATAEDGMHHDTPKLRLRGNLGYLAMEQLPRPSAREATS
ncbi:MAG: hypothetical protein K8H88_19725 [Sandaracinaceae bacterium]|nr:hypothetical protein [Sandaracinaceae bacterium]